MRYMVFDVESVGLHGEGFAVGWVIIDERGIEYASGHYACDPNKAQKQDDDSLSWVENFCDWIVNVETPRHVRDEFWAAYNDCFYGIPGTDAMLVCDVPWPVESRFLVQCLVDNPKRAERGPYPILDVASIRYAAGLSPLGSEKRYPDELPKHNALADARQSARLLLEAIQIIGRR